jgi:hypothetical protein
MKTEIGGNTEVSVFPYFAAPHTGNTRCRCTGNSWLPVFSQTGHENSKTATRRFQKAETACRMGGR